MAMIALTPEVFPDRPILWMDDVGPVIIVGNYAFCCECEPCTEPQSIDVNIYEKPKSIPENPDDMIPKTRAVGKRNFQDESNMLHIRNFIIKFAKDPQYRKDFMV